jgi:RimJ/RimL family protein N-acetyltransferase
MSHEIQENELSIRLMEKSDVEDARVLHNDPSVLRQLTDPRPVSELQQATWFETLSRSQSSQRYVVRNSVSDYLIGIFRVDNIDLVNKSVMVGLDIAPKYRGRGISHQVYKHFIDHFFNEVGIQRIYLYVLETNEVAHHIYKKLGFEEEGRQRQAIFREGRYVDYIMMSLLKSNHDVTIQAPKIGSERIAQAFESGEFYLSCGVSPAVAHNIAEQIRREEQRHLAQSTIIASKVVSDPGERVKVTEFTLSPSAQKQLQIKSEIPSPTKPQGRQTK